MVAEDVIVLVGLDVTVVVGVLVEVVVALEVPDVVVVVVAEDVIELVGLDVIVVVGVLVGLVVGVVDAVVVAEDVTELVGLDVTEVVGVLVGVVVALEVPDVVAVVVGVPVCVVVAVVVGHTGDGSSWQINSSLLYVHPTRGLQSLSGKLLQPEHAFVSVFHPHATPSKGEHVAQVDPSHEAPVLCAVPTRPKPKKAKSLIFGQCYS